MKVDLVIVGAGIAAAAVVRRVLKARPSTSILVLEAGGKVKMRDFAVYQQYVATGGTLDNGTLPYQAFYDLEPRSVQDPSIKLPPDAPTQGENRFTGDLAMTLQGARLMMYGGTTVHWDGYSFRFKPEDFHLKSNTGHGIDWPFDYAALEPWYGEAERFIGVSGDSEDGTVPRSTGFPYPAFPYTLEDAPVMKAFDRLGIGYSHLPIARHGVNDTTSSTPPCQTTGTCLYCPFGARYNAANDLDELLAAPSLTIRTRAVTEQLLMDSKSRARGVVFVDTTTGQRTTVEAGTVVVAAGTVESPKLLQRSVSGHWPHGVGNDRDLVGRNIVTHPWITFSARAPSNPRRLQPEMAFPTLVSRHFDNEREQHHGKFIFVSPWNQTGIDLAGAMRRGVPRSAIDQMVRGPQTLQLNAMFEIFSRHEYRVSNTAHVNHLGMRESLVHFDDTPIIRERLATVKATATKVLHAMGASGEVTMEADWGAHHACCTTRMSHSPEDGVVDPDLRVHGTDNVYVCSNASFATLSAVNPTLTLAALSLRLGDLLAARLGGSRP